MKKTIIRPNIVQILAAITFVCVVVGAIIFQMEWIRFVPLLISIGVMFLQTRVSRFAFLLGAFNCLLYTIADMQLTLYTSAFYALLVSCPMQIITFFTWHKHTRQSQTATQRISFKGRVILLAGMAVAWVILYLIFASLGSEYLLLDNTTTIISLGSVVLCLLRYSEHALLQIISTFFAIVLYAYMMIDDLSMVVWLIFNIYSIICSFFTLSAMSKQANMCKS